jgi:hypothetical protein
VSVSFIIIIQFKENTMLKQVLATTLFVGALVAATETKETPKDSAPTPAAVEVKDAKHKDAKHEDAKHDKKGHEAKTPDATPAPAVEAKKDDAATPAKEVK